MVTLPPLPPVLEPAVKEIEPEDSVDVPVPTSRAPELDDADDPDVILSAPVTIVESFVETATEPECALLCPDMTRI